MDGAGRGRTLVLIKHAMPVIEPHAPPSGWCLSEEGRLQSVALAGRLEGYDLERVVTSEEPKAAETAQIVAEQLGLSWTSASGLHEHDRTGATFGTREDFELATKTSFDNPGTPVWGNETAGQARARFAGGVGAVLEEYPEGNLALVAHGTVNTLFLAQHQKSTLSISGAGSVCHPSTPFPFPTSGCWRRSSTWTNDPASSWPVPAHPRPRLPTPGKARDVAIPRRDARVKAR